MPQHMQTVAYHCGNCSVHWYIISVYWRNKACCIALLFLLFVCFTALCFCAALKHVKISSSFLSANKGSFVVFDMHALVVRAPCRTIDVWFPVFFCSKWHSALHNWKRLLIKVQFVSESCMFSVPNKIKLDFVLHNGMTLWTLCYVWQLILSDAFALS